MNANFQRLMADATRLTRSGDLHAATAAIQAALAGAHAPARPRHEHDDDDVIDVEVREVHAPLARLAFVGGVHAPAHDASGDARNDPRFNAHTAYTAQAAHTAQAAQRAEASEPAQASQASQSARAAHGTHAGPPGGRASEARRPASDPLFAAAPAAAHAGQFIAGSHTESAGTREYKLYVPPGYRGQPMPLVVMLHGCTQNPDDFAAGTGMNAAALERGFLVLYPAQAQKMNPQRCWNWFKHNHQARGRGEPALLAGMTREVMKRYNVDPRRVYVAGLSAGGAMAAILGDAYPELFAAVGVHSGLPTGSATDMPSAFAAMKGGAASIAASAHAPPTIVFHGDRDATVHPVNGEQIVVASARAAQPERVREHSANGRSYTRCVYRDERGRAVAEHWVVHGAGHAWSGGSARGSYTDATGPDATGEMLRFFFANALHTDR